MKATMAVGVDAGTERGAKALVKATSGQTLTVSTIFKSMARSNVVVNSTLEAIGAKTVSTKPVYGTKPCLLYTSPSPRDS